MTIYSYKGQVNLISTRLKQRRKELKLSQTNLSAKLQIEGVMIEQRAISRIEAGDRIVTDYEALNIAKVLKVDLIWLLTGKQNL